MKKNLFWSLLLGICLTPFVLLAQQSSAVELEKHVTYLASEELQGRGLGTEGALLARQYIKDQFMAAQCKPFVGDDLWQEFQLRMGLAWIPAVNVVGMLEGTDPLLKDEYIVLGAHYDHQGYSLSNGVMTIFPGADDNASGVAAIIELAKYYSLPENRPERSLIFIAFDAEESGLLGAKHFVSELSAEQKSSVKAMFSFDMVGMLSAYKGLDLKGIGALEGGEKLAKKWAQEAEISLKNTSANIEQRTDTAPFAEVGIPSIHVFTGLKSPYHKPEDKADLLDYSGMAKVVDLSALLIKDLANSPSISPTTAFAKNPEFSGIGASGSSKFSLNLLANLGSGHHDYVDNFFKAKPAFSYAAGLGFNFKLSANTHVNMEGLYDYNTSQSAFGTFRRHSLTLPLNLEYGISPVGGFRAYLFGGAYYRKHLSGKDGDTNLDFDRAYNSDEWGYSLGWGFDIQKFKILFTRRMGITPILSPDFGVKTRAQGTFLTLGYKLY
jgi:aminopeptidase YwaD